MTYYSPEDHHLKMRSTRFVRRMFAMRQLGTILCALPIASVLMELGKKPAILVLLISNVIFWPCLAYCLAITSRDSTARERTNLTLDAAFGGIWVALMAVSPMPSFVIMAVLVSDRYAAGGWPQLLSALQAFLFAFIMVWTIEGAPVLMEFSIRSAWLTIPLATFYLLALSVVSHNLTFNLRQKNRELERIALMDPSLQIPNRRLFERRLESEFLRTRRGDSKAYLILIDVDHFKNVNDTFGHEAGDFLLAEISGLLRDSVGMKDIPARFGGDELGVIVRDSNDVNIVRLAETIQRNIAQLRLPASAEFRCSVSIGIACAEKASSIHEWLRRADEALYEVKRSGRNGQKLWQA